MKSILPKRTSLGQLDFFEIYDDYCGPKTFSVRNNLNQLFLVYWEGDYDGYSSWLYSPISEKRLDSFVKGSISLLSIYIKPEIKNILIKVNDNGTYFEENLSNTKGISLPPQSFSFFRDDIVCLHTESKWSFRLKIAKRKTGRPSDSAVTDIINVIGKTFKEMAVGFKSNEFNSYPQSALFSSFDIKMSSSNLEVSEDIIISLYEIINETIDFDSIIKSKDVDPFIIKEIMTTIISEDLCVSLSPKLTDLTLEIDVKKAKVILDRINASVGIKLPSSIIPQANDIDALISLVELSFNGKPLIHDNIKSLNSPRLIAYYVSAAIDFGFLNKNKSVTASGESLLRKKNKIAQYEYISDRFESSRCGIAWMKWANVDTIKDLNEKDINAFLKDCVYGLSKETRSRRENTLKSWLQILKKHCRDYH